MMNCNRVEEKDIIIWGAGNYGRFAYHYYKEKCNILCYVDNDKNKWGQSLNGIPICEPDVIKDKEVQVVIALKHGINEVKEILQIQYNKDEVIIWGMMESTFNLKDDDRLTDQIDKDTFVIYMRGGLGNQMFQYAFLRYLEFIGKKVVADISFYSKLGVMPFSLTKVFNNVKLEICTHGQIRRLIAQNTDVDGNVDVNFLFYSESQNHEVVNGNADEFFKRINGGIINGYHQHLYYPECIRKILLREFEFDVWEGSKLYRIGKQINQLNAVGIHVRRGDYLTKSSQLLYGNICTLDYYKSAIKYICSKENNTTLVFFSNDMDWVKHEFIYDNAIYIEESMFDDYQDWYDMYLMSACKHNIIANSTFSWWGAWLNTNKNKIIIAPTKWINLCEYNDIYPKEWITL